MAGGEAGTRGCICDPDESPSCVRTAATSGQSDDKTPGGKTPTSEADYGTAARFVALAPLAWPRLRT